MRDKRFVRLPNEIVGAIGVGEKIYLNFEQEESPVRAQGDRAVGVCACDG